MDYIPVLIADREGAYFKRAFVSRKQFELWRNNKAMYIYIRDDSKELNVSAVIAPIIVTMNGFAYDKILQLHGYPLLRNRRLEFNFDINKLTKL